MEHQTDIPDEVRLAACASRAVGVSDRMWFIAMVGNNTEKSSYTKLSSLGYEAYLPTQEVETVWKDGRRKTHERILLPNIVLLHITEAERMNVVNLPYVKRFMVDKAGTVNAFNRHPIAVIPDKQIETLKFMLGNSDAEVTFTPRRISKGDKVKVVRGKLAGLTGTVLKEPSGKSKLYISIDFLGCASLEIKEHEIVIANII